MFHETIKEKSMKRKMSIAIFALMACPLLVANASPKDDVAAAAAKLADGGNYSWKSTMEATPNSQRTPGPTQGKIDKDGSTWMSSTFNDNTIEGVKVGDKVAVKGEDGWQAASEISGGGGGGGFNPATGMARRLQNLKAPAAEAQDILTKVKDIAKDGDAYTGELTDEGAKAIATRGFGRPGGGGGNRPAPTDLKGSVKFWIKDGALTKYQTKVSGKRQNQDGEEQAFERTTTVEIKDVGTTKVTLPEDAKKKLT
jgi:hypothetical protein